MAIEFDNVDDFISLGNPASLKLTGNMTITAWVKLNNIPSSTMDVITKYSAGDRSYFFRINEDAGPGLWRFYFIAGRNGVNATTFGAISADTWYFVVGMVDGSNNKISVNGGTFNTNTRSAPVGGNDRVDIGASNGVSLFWDGQIDELAIWSKALSDNDIADLYNSKIKGMPLQVQPANLVAYWPMDNGPDGASADGDTIRDLSGNGSDGIGDNGANNTGLTWKAEEVLSYPPSVLPVIFVPVAAAIMNQFQGPNLGADLYNGSFM